jgi:hypothetical protein
MGNHPLNESSERERVQSRNGSGVLKLAFCQERHDAGLRVRIKPSTDLRCRVRCAPPIEGTEPMQVPSILLGESRTRLLQGIAIGAIASMVIGFSWGGWVLGGTAHRLAADQASTAVVTVLTPICVEKFLHHSTRAILHGLRPSNGFH